LFFRIYGIILPIDFHIFQDGYCTANQHHSYGKWPFIVSFPVKNCDFP
jgi:hypothetical protein